MKKLTIVICFILHQSNSIPLRNNRQTPENFPQLTRNLYNEYQYDQHLLNSGNIDTSNLEANLHQIALRFINSVKQTFHSFANHNTVQHAEIHGFLPPEKTYAPEWTGPETVTENYQLFEADIRKLPIKTRNDFAETTEENIEYFKGLALPEEGAFNIFLTKNSEAAESVSGINLTELSIPEQDSINIFYKNKGNVNKLASINLQDSAENVATNMYNFIYKFPLPLPESGPKFLTTTPKTQLNIPENFQFPEKDFQLPKHDFQVHGGHVQLPVGHLELPEDNFQLPGRNNKQINYSSLSEIPLEDSPVFDLNKMGLTNSYGKVVTKFRRNVNNN